jgi:hypothetical protein
LSNHLEYLVNTQNDKNAADTQHYLVSGKFSHAKINYFMQPGMSISKLLEGGSQVKICA